MRSSYSEPFYTNLAREAIALWKDEKGELGLQGLYHEYVAIHIPLSPNIKLTSPLDQAYSSYVLSRTQHTRTTRMKTTSHPARESRQ